MAAPQWELNLFSADPRLLQPLDDRHYEGGAAALAGLASSTRLRLLHALMLGERSVQRAAAWARVPQARAEAELRELERRGLVVSEAREGEPPEYVPSDGHLVALLYVALAHGGEPALAPQPLLLRPKRRVASARVRAGE